MSLEKQFHDAILRRNFNAFLHRVVMTLNPGTFSLSAFVAVR
jgi:hypothetical protein